MSLAADRWLTSSDAADTRQWKETPMSEPAEDTPVLDLLAAMTAQSMAVSNLDPDTLTLVRIAALVAVDAPAVSYVLNLGMAAEVGVDGDQVRGVLAAIAPIVGTARVAAATSKIVEAVGLAIDVAELDSTEDR
jgi:4-carboxymuconolactone decarboxylase